MGEGVRSARPAARVAAIPLADGGDGTLDVLADRLQASVETVRVTGPAGSPTDARLALTEDEAIIESADAAGNRPLEPGQRDPFETSTFGVGELIRQALDRGVGRIVVAVGGTGTIDVGAGALQALGVRFLDDRGSDLEPTPRGSPACDPWTWAGSTRDSLARSWSCSPTWILRCATALGSTAHRRGSTREADRSWRHGRVAGRHRAALVRSAVRPARPMLGAGGAAGRARRIPRRERRRRGGLRRAPGRLARGTRGGRRPAHRRGPAGFDLLPRQGPGTRSPPPTRAGFARACSPARSRPGQTSTYRPRATASSSERTPAVRRRRPWTRSGRRPPAGPGRSCADARALSRQPRVYVRVTPLIQPTTVARDSTPKT